MSRLNNRLTALEQSVKPVENIFFGSVLIDMVSYSMMPFAVALLTQGRNAEAREFVEIASSERGLDLTDVQVDTALRYIVKHLDSHRVSLAKPIRYWVRDQAEILAAWRKDAAFLANNRRLCGWTQGPETDEDAIYAQTVEFWRQRNGATSEELIRRRDAEHEQQMWAIAERIALLRLGRGIAKGPQVDKELIYGELLRLEDSIARPT